MALNQLAAAEQVKAPTMSRIVSGLQRSSLAKIEADPNDARRIRVTATAKGERLLQQARTRRVQQLAELFSEATPRDLDTLQRAAQLIEQTVKQAAERKQ
jgi:DNA-binding MarR family transcriptional regulator